MTEQARPPVRDRLVAAADELFYAEGVQTVGVDRIIDRAGVAKASLYRTFGGKDDLAAEYLGARHRANLGQLRDAVTAVEDPAGRVLEVFAVQSGWLASPGYRGCPFTRASAEAPDGSLVRAAVDAYRRDVRRLLTQLAEGVGAADVAGLALQLEVLFHGAPVLVGVEGGREITDAVRGAVVTLLRAATPLAAPPRSTTGPTGATGPADQADAT